GRAFSSLTARGGGLPVGVMTLPQSGRLDGGEQPQGLPDECAQRLRDVTVFPPAFGIELLLGCGDKGGWWFGLHPTVETTSPLAQKVSLLQLRLRPPNGRVTQSRMSP